MPHEYGAWLSACTSWSRRSRDVVLSVHCHDDLGLAVANSFAGLRAGARQVECAINGIGERAGNASLEEIVMLLHTRAADIGLRTAVNTREIARTSRLVSRLTGYVVQPNKAIVGRNAFAHESGIHQDGVLKERTTYEIMDATSVGLAANSLVLGKHSGRHALRQALENLGIEVQGQALNTAFKRFKEIADRKKTVSAMDLEALVTDELREEIAGYTLESYELEAGTRARAARRRHRAHADGGPVRGRVQRRRLRRLGVRARSTPRPGSTRVSASSASTPSPRARTPSARSRSSSSCGASPPRARASRPTSSRRRRAPTCAR